MTAAIGKYGLKYAMRKMYKSGRNDPASRNSKYDDWDPKYEWIENPRNGKMKKVKKDLSYIPKHDLAVYEKVRTRAIMLDSCFNIGIGRAGLSSIIGFIPGVGDVSDVVLAYWIYHLCKEVDGGLSPKDKSRMKRNIVVDGFIGLVPFLGDIADTAFKANMRNLKILEEHLKDKYDPVDQNYRKSGKTRSRSGKRPERSDYDRRSISSLDEDEVDDPPRRLARREWDGEYDREDAGHMSRSSRRERRY